MGERSIIVTLQPTLTNTNASLPKPGVASTTCQGVAPLSTSPFNPTAFTIGSFLPPPWAHGGGRKEPIVKAVGLKGDVLKGATPWHVVDATPGLGRDAFVLVSVGCKVTMIERSPIVAALLEDGIRRLQQRFPELAERLALQHGNSADVMQYWNGENVDAIYLDPMFPHKKKSADFFLCGNIGSK